MAQEGDNGSDLDTLSVTEPGVTAVVAGASLTPRPGEPEKEPSVRAITVPTKSPPIVPSAVDPLVVE